MSLFPEVNGKNKILLYYPKIFPPDMAIPGKASEPITVITLADHLMAKGFTVEIFDHRIKDDFTDELAACGDELLCVGISAMAGFQLIDGHNFA